MVFYDPDTVGSKLAMSIFFFTYFLVLKALEVLIRHYEGPERNKEHISNMTEKVGFESCQVQTFFLRFFALNRILKSN